MPQHPKLILQIDKWGDPTPDDVYDAISKALVMAGAGDLEIYQLFEETRKVFTKVYEMQQFTRDGYG